MVGDRAVAEEIAQEAFTRAWRHAGAYDARRGRVATWLLSITRNLAIDHLRAKRTEPLDPQTIQAAQRPLWAAGPPPDAAERETAELCESLAELPADQRRALLLAALFGFTAREIGEIEDIPLGTAKTRIRTATQKLAAAEGDLR
jgi:RNA polymerase sigma factor (sigma-70 family)